MPDISYGTLVQITSHENKKLIGWIGVVEAVIEMTTATAYIVRLERTSTVYILSRGELAPLPVQPDVDTNHFNNWYERWWENHQHDDPAITFKEALFDAYMHGRLVQATRQKKEE